MCQHFSTTKHLGQCGTSLTLAKKTKISSIILGYTFARLILRDRMSASEKYMIEVVRQNTVGGGHNVIDSSTPFCKFQAFPCFCKRNKKTKQKTIQFMCVNTNPVSAPLELCMALNGV